MNKKKILKEEMRSRMEEGYEEWAKAHHFDSLLHKAFKEVWMKGAAFGIILTAQMVKEGHKL